MITHTINKQEWLQPAGNKISHTRCLHDSTSTHNIYMGQQFTHIIKSLDRNNQKTVAKQHESEV